VDPPSVLRSNRKNVFIAKIWAPLLCLAATLGMFRGDLFTWRFLFAVPFLVVTMWGFSLAILERRGGVLHYRRFFKWMTFAEDEVVTAGVVFLPFVGYLRLNRFISPWGRLYFVLDKNAEPNPFRRGEFPLVRYLKREELPAERQSSVLSSKAPLANLLLAASIGILTCVMISYLIPGDLFQGGLPKPTADMPTLLKTLLQFLGWFHMSAVQVVGVVAMALLTVSRRNKPEAWLYAFLSGFALAMIVGRLLS
jgi:hypothetical protein